MKNCAWCAKNSRKGGLRREPSAFSAQLWQGLSPSCSRSGVLHLHRRRQKISGCGGLKSRGDHRSSGSLSNTTHRRAERRQCRRTLLTSSLPCISGRAPYVPMLPEWGHISPCYCYRCPLGLTYPACNVACADELEKFLLSVSSETVAAFILEPVVGATLGAVTPPEGYLQRIFEICRRQGILLIADEVMTGLGRTGTHFAVEHWGVVPDMILVGKAVASGYAPLGGVLVAPRVAEAIAQGSGRFEHGFTYQAHPVAMAAGLAVLDYISEHQLFERVAPAGRALLQALRSVEGHAYVGDVRGCGLLLGVEFVRDRTTREPFPREANLAERIRQAALEEGITTYPIQGCVDGERGDHVLLAPPFIISSDEISEIARALGAAVERVAESRSEF